MNGYIIEVSTVDRPDRYIYQGIVREPALSDGRLKPGDKLVSANGVDLSSFSHQVFFHYFVKQFLSRFSSIKKINYTKEIYCQVKIR